MPSTISGMSMEVKTRRTKRNPPQYTRQKQDNKGVRASLTPGLLSPSSSKGNSCSHSMSTVPACTSALRASHCSGQGRVRRPTSETTSGTTLCDAVWPCTLGGWWWARCLPPSLFCKPQTHSSALRLMRTANWPSVNPCWGGHTL